MSEYSKFHSGISLEFTEQEFSSQARNFVYSYQEHLPDKKSAPILDLGCGNGLMLYGLQLHGYSNLLGVDSDRASIDFVNETLGIEAICEDVFSYLEKTSEKYAVISLNEVLEHISKERVAMLLKLARNALQEEGILICRVPNLENPMTTYTRWHDFTHTVGFTQHSLKMCMRKANFSEVNVFPLVYPSPLLGKFLRPLRYLLRKGVRFFLQVVFEYPPGGILFEKKIFSIARKK